MGRVGAQMHEANNRHNARRAKRKAYEKALKEAESRRIEINRQLQVSLKTDCMARNPHWFLEAA